jgi:rfaE bifunctional protein nucleotidyltransferase chain/domain
VNMPRHASQKIFERDALIDEFGHPRELRVVFTNGCFDVLHRGHVEYLAAARRMGDVLVVGVNSDDSVCRLKGPGRPINPEGDRATVLAALEAVDAVTLFSEDTPLALIQRLLPDVLVKGGDYEVSNIVGASEVAAAGGEVVVVPLVPGRSTTNILQRMNPGSSR